MKYCCIAILLFSTSGLWAQDTTARLESLPRFPGDVNAFIAYVHESIIYPDSAIDLNQSGTVIVLFEVDTNGAILNPKVVKGIPDAPYLDREALRVIRNMPAWEPARMNGKPFKMSMSVPVRFIISQEDVDRRTKELKEKKKAEKKKSK